MRLDKSFRFAFTLTEILIAVGIVGVIAALVLPSIVLQYQSIAQDHMYERVQQTISESLRRLAVDENTVNFGGTSMYLLADPDSYEGSSGKFIKKYLSVGKYFGDASTNAAQIKAEAFADKYYTYTNNEKDSTEGVSRREFSPDLKGSCALLKNGAAICLKPQVLGTGAEGIIDLNGKKGPNIEGRDYRVISLERVLFDNFEDTVKNINPDALEVNTTDHVNIAGDDGNPCVADDYSRECCLYKAEKGAITEGSICCSTSAASEIPACANEIKLSLFTPKSSCKLPGCRPEITTSSKAYDGNGKQLTALTKEPPRVYLYCEGRQAGYIEGALIRAIIEKKMSRVPFTITMSSIIQVFRKPDCGTGTGSGINNSRGSMVFTTAGVYQNYEYSGTKWTVTYR